LSLVCLPRLCEAWKLDYSDEYETPQQESPLKVLREMQLISCSLVFFPSNHHHECDSIQVTIAWSSRVETQYLCITYDTYQMTWIY